MTKKAKSKSKSNGKAKTAKHVAANSKATSVLTLKAGVTPDGRRGLMGKMVEAVAKAKRISRGDLQKRFAKEPAVKVAKNIGWGLRHDVFKEARA